MERDAAFNASGAPGRKRTSPPPHSFALAHSRPPTQAAKLRSASDSLASSSRRVPSPYSPPRIQLPQTPGASSTRPPSSRRALTAALELAQEAIRIDSAGEEPLAAIEAYGKAVTLIKEVMDRVMRGEGAERRRAGVRRRSDAAREDEVRRLKPIHDVYADRMQVLQLIYQMDAGQQVSPSPDHAQNSVDYERSTEYNPASYPTEERERDRVASSGTVNESSTVVNSDPTPHQQPVAEGYRSTSDIYRSRMRGQDKDGGTSIAQEMKESPPLPLDSITPNLPISNADVPRSNAGVDAHEHGIPPKHQPTPVVPTFTITPQRERRSHLPPIQEPIIDDNGSKEEDKREQEREQEDKKIKDVKVLEPKAAEGPITADEETTPHTTPTGLPEAEREPATPTIPTTESSEPPLAVSKSDVVPPAKLKLPEGAASLELAASPTLDDWDLVSILRGGEVIHNDRGSRLDHDIFPSNETEKYGSTVFRKAFHPVLNKSSRPRTPVKPTAPEPKSPTVPIFDDLGPSTSPNNKRRGRLAGFNLGQIFRPKSSPVPASDVPIHGIEETSEVTEVPQPNTLKSLAAAMHKSLVEHGCPDLEQLVDPNGFSSSAVAEGGFGDIWAGRYRDGTKLGIKVLRFTPVTDDAAEKQLKRAMREIYNWSKLEHENVHKLMGVILFRERLGMVSRWMEHGNLRQYLERNSDIDRYQLCTQIAKGMAYIHSVGMIHGDLKACNILVSSDGVLKITDFDHSMISDCSLLFSTTTGVGGGTLRWMAPELLMAESPPQRNKNTDIYALGMTFLETMTNAHPFSECQRENQVLFKHMRKEHPMRPKDFFPDTERSNRLWSHLVRCWDHDPTSRPTADATVALLLALK